MDAVNDLIRPTILDMEPLFLSSPMLCPLPPIAIGLLLGNGWLGEGGFLSKPQSLLDEESKLTDIELCFVNIDSYSYFNISK